MSYNLKSTLISISNHMHLNHIIRIWHLFDYICKDVDLNVNNIINLRLTLIFWMSM